MDARSTLLVIGIHREELPFGAAVAAELDRSRIDVLTIPEGLPGRRPRADQCFRYETLHRELYRQLLPHVLPRHSLLIDLHTGVDPRGSCADIYCGDASLSRALAAALDRHAGPAVRLIALRPARDAVEHTDTHMPYADTVIPARIWSNAAFRYVGIEIYLAETGRGQPAEWNFARELIGIVTRCNQIVAPTPRIVVR